MSLLNHRSTRSLTGPDDLDIDGATGVGGVASQAVETELPRVVIVDGEPADPIEELLLGAASGDREAFEALESRMGGLVHANIRRVLRDASRSHAVTQEFFAEVPRDAANFDPDQNRAQAWLLTRAHQCAMSGLASGEAPSY